MVRVLIVGAGLTGALCAQLIRRHLPTTRRGQCQITVWEQSPEVGGRMSLSEAPEIEDCSAELGAQYITQDSKYLDSHMDFYADLLDCDVIQPFKGVIDDVLDENNAKFVCKQGLSSIAKHYFDKSSVKLCANVRLESLRVVAGESWNVWEACSSSGNHDRFDAVILTMPAPQILSIDGVKGQLKEDQISDLQSVEYSSRFALGLFYNKDVASNFSYDVKRFYGNDVISNIAIDQKKRGLQRNTSSIVVHTSEAFGKLHADEDAESVGGKVLEELKKICPNLPNPDFVKCHIWRYSQVTHSTKTNGSMVACTNPLLILAGDCFTHSNFDGCIESALSVSSSIRIWESNLPLSLVLHFATIVTRF